MDGGEAARQRVWHVILFYFVLWVEKTISKLHEPEVDPKVPTTIPRFQCYNFDEFASLGRFGRVSVSGRGMLDKDVCRRHARRGIL